METSPLKRRLESLFYSEDERIIAIEIVKFMQEGVENPPVGYKGPKRDEITNSVLERADERHHRVYDSDQVNEVISELESQRVIHARDGKKSEFNRHYFLDKSYRKLDS